MRVINFNDKLFPNILKDICDVPKQIFVEGNVNILNDYAISIIGSRSCTDYGKRWCKKFVCGLIEYNLVVVSGMAIGIDTAAHSATLDYGGKTIAVLPCGFNNIYPEENINLYRRIIDLGGAVISEYPPNVEANSKRFLERNRIVSGLSIGTLVIEAGYRSGTSVTAKLAREQRREVFCLPGSLDNGKSIGTNNLIKSGAKLVTCVEDIVENYNYLERSKMIYKDLNKMDFQNKDIWNLLTNGPLGVSELMKITNLKVNDIMAKLSVLELEGKIKKLPGNRFMIV